VATGAQRSSYRLRACGIITLPGEVGPHPHRLFARGVSCDRARRIIRRSAETGATPRGWRCIGSGAETFCAPGSWSSVSALERSRRHDRRYVDAKGIGSA
jgi:hypothetical protein